MKTGFGLKAISMALMVVLTMSFSSIAEAAGNAYTKKWGTFTTKTFHGTGDDFIDLSSAKKAGIIVATHEGDSNFIVESLDAYGNSIDLLVNEIGWYEGEALFGFGWSSKKAKSFEIQADGDWTITIKDVNKAPKFTSSGYGPHVMKYQGGLKRYRISHTGDSNFIVEEYCTNGYDDLVINEIGTYSGRKQLSGGNCLISVQADGDWKFKK